MELKEIKLKQQKITDAVLTGNLSTAFKLIPELAYYSRNASLITELELLEQTYKNILRYSFGYAKDPERDKIYNNLRRQLLELNDDISAAILDNTTDWFATSLKKEVLLLSQVFPDNSGLVEEMTVEKEFSSLLRQVDSRVRRDQAEELKYSQSLNKIFNLMWLTTNFTETEKGLCQRFFQNQFIPWHDKSIVVSAIFLSALQHFDRGKTDVLFDIYQQDEPQVSQRALVSIVLLLLSFESRLALYPEIIARAKSIINPGIFARQTEQIILQLIRAQETEKVTRKIQDEIIPEVMKLKPEIEEKLKLDELFNKDKTEEKNPDWEQFFGDTPEVYKKLEEFSMMQMDGSDVFMGAFSLLKRFGFFDSMSNWFLPFYKEHSEIEKSVKGVADNFNWNNFFEGIEQAPVMCNSDKYSFCFNLGFMPEMQKSMILEYFNAELGQMKEAFTEDNKHNVSANDKVIFTQYIQDLYRFFKLHPNRMLFTDIFKLSLQVENSKLLLTILEEKNIRQVAEFYFKKNYFDQAQRLFLLLSHDEPNFELNEKIGFCLQKSGRYRDAIKYYKQAELLESGKVWLQKKLGYCLRKAGEFDEAIAYYKKVERVEPENLEIQAYLGQLHIDKEEYEEALKYYFKVEYLKPDLAKVQRPIGWCSFLLGKSDQALHYFRKVAESEGQRSDYLNLAHCYWVTGNLSEALENYRKALKQSVSDINWLSNALRKDSIYLKRYGIDELDVALMADYLMIEFQ